MSDSNHQSHLPRWGSFLGFADFDVLSFGWLFAGGLYPQGIYHLAQAIEKYLKALALAVLDPNERVDLRNNKAFRTHDLLTLAFLVVGECSRYASDDVVESLRWLNEFEQPSRYPEPGLSFTTGDFARYGQLVVQLRRDIPIRTDDYPLAIALRRHHYGRPEAKVRTPFEALLQYPVAAVRSVFPDIDDAVRW